MTEQELINECKIGLGYQVDTPIDQPIKQKIATVKSFMKRAGVSEETLNSEDAVGTIVMGVGDIWNQEAGAVKFSPAFMMFVAQLAD